MVAPLGNNSSTLNIKPCPPSYILKNFTGRKWPVFVVVYVNCIAQLLVFFLNCGKKFAKWHVYFSLLVQEQTFLLCSLEIPLFSSCDLKCLNFFEFTLPQQKNLKKRKTPGKMWFYNPQRDQSQNTTFLKRGTIISKHRKSNMFNTVYWFSYHLFFSNHNEKISVLSS